MKFGVTPSSTRIMTTDRPMAITAIREGTAQYVVPTDSHTAGRRVKDGLGSGLDRAPRPSGKPPLPAVGCDGEAGTTRTRAAFYAQPSCSPAPRVLACQGSYEVERQCQEHVDREQQDAFEPRRLTILGDGVDREGDGGDRDKFQRAREYEIHGATYDCRHDH